MLRKTATKYLGIIVNAGLLHKVKIRKTDDINTELMNLFINHAIESASWA